jgi:hypothetical protein
MIAILDRTGMTGEGVNSLMLMAGPSEDEAGPMFSVKIDGYAEGTTSYSDVSISYNKDMSDPYAGYFVGNGTVNITSIDDESISFNFNSTGMYLAIIGTSYEMDYSATFAGSGTMMLNTMKNNVAWADLKLPADVPELFSPADFAQRNTYSAWFGYINRPKSDYEAIKTKFVNAGYSVALAENTEGTETTIQYRKGAINVTVDYNPNGANKFDSVLVDDIYTISVEIDNSGAPL